MSMMLNLVERLFAKAQFLHAIGRQHDALHILTALSGFQDLPAEVAEKTQALLAEIHVEHGRFRRARRHLTAALRHRPDCAEYHYQLAGALDADGKGDIERAAEHYRQSLELNPDQPQCQSEYGLLCVELGRTEEGLRQLREAFEKLPADPVPAQNLASGLRLAGRTSEARAALLAARFRNPRDPRFRKLWDDFQFQELHQQQEDERRERSREAALEEGPVLLPFLRVVPAVKRSTVRGKIIRHDGPAPTNPPHRPQPIRRSDRRRA